MWRKENRRVLCVLCLAAVLLALSACKKQGLCFSIYNLRNMSEQQLSEQADYQKNGVQIGEVYADPYVLSFMISPSGWVYATSESGAAKNFQVAPLDSGSLVQIPGYRETDQLILNDESGRTLATMALSEFFRGQTAVEDTPFRSGTRFQYHDRAYHVTSINRTAAYLILHFDPAETEPAELQSTLEIRDETLNNRSDWFLNGYDLYIADFPHPEKGVYFRFSDDPQVVFIAMTR